MEKKTKTKSMLSRSLFAWTGARWTEEALGNMFSFMI